jgi:battenin
MTRRFPAKDDAGDTPGGADREALAREDHREALRDNVAFFLAGLVNNVVFVVYLSAAEDLLQNSAGVILLVSVLPGLLTKMALPFFADRLSYGLRVAMTCLTLCVCCVGVASSASVLIRLSCIGLSSCAGALGEVTFLSLSSLYRPSTIGAWSSGTGFAGVSGSSIYHFIRAVLGMSSRQAILSAAPFTLGMWISFSWILTPTRSEFPYARISSARDSSEVPAGGSADGRDFADSASFASMPCSDSGGYEPVTFDESPYGLSPRRVAFPWLLCEYIVPLMLVYFFEYVINQGISPTLDRFPSDLKPTGVAERSHLYTLYQAAYQSGVFVSRSSIEFVKVRRIWMFPFLQAVNCLVLFTAALFSFLPHRYSVVGIMFFEGLVGGGMYVNAFYKLRHTCPTALKAWALGAAGVGDAAGVTLAALVNIVLECGIRRLRGEQSCQALA